MEEDMKLYKLELSKIIGRKFTWIMTGMLLVVMTFSLWVENNMASKLIASNDFGQSLGYYRFIDLSQFFVLYVMIWLTAVLSPFYCEDRQNGTDVLIMTSAKGKISDFAARLCVTFTLAVGSLIFVFITTYCICYMLYGYSGGSSSAYEIYFWVDETASSLADKSIYAFIGYYLIKALFAVLMLSGIIVWVSAGSNKAMYSLITILAIFWCPLMLESGLHLGGIFYLFMTGQPVYLIVVRYFHENWPLYGWHIILALLVAAVGVVWGGRRWCLQRKL